MIGFIINPVAAHGTTEKLWPALRAELHDRFGNSFKPVFTEHPLHATELTRQLLMDGVQKVIAVGGDGTLNEVVNGFLDQNEPINPDSTLGVISMGTGADFIRTLEWPKDVSAALDRFDNNEVRKIDIGRAEYLSLDGTIKHRYFVNIADFGLGGAVVDRVNRTTKRFGGKVTFLWGIIHTLLTYKNKIISFQLDNGEWQTELINNFIIGNGRYYGGGLNPTPMAALDDGILDVITIGDVSFFEAIRNLSRLRKGTHLSHPKIFAYKVKKVRAQSPEKVLIDFDGECIGQLPIQIEVVPKAIPVLC